LINSKILKALIACLRIPAIRRAAMTMTDVDNALHVINLEWDERPELLRADRVAGKLI